jgi:hypothetical protein
MKEYLLSYAVIVILFFLSSFLVYFNMVALRLIMIAR